MKKNTPLFYFSINEKFIPKDVPLPFDLYINSSTLTDKPHYIRIKNILDNVSAQELQLLKNNYETFYVPESQRASIFQIMGDASNRTEMEKINFFKDFTIQYLDVFFNSKLDEFQIEMLLGQAADSIQELVKLFKGKNISDVSKIIDELAAHDFYTYDHSLNVAIYTSVFYSSLFKEASVDRIVAISLAALLHDIGKIKIPNEILNKPGPFENEEFKEIKLHPQYGIELIKNIDSKDPRVDISILKKVIFEHHENCNGTGYPSKIHSDDISIEAKIVAITDFYDAITTKRPYCETYTTEEALLLMERSCGKKIDGDLFIAFKKIIKQMIFNGFEKKQLADEFDQCMPNLKLPLVYESIVTSGSNLTLKNHLKKILIIDDDESFINILSVYLKKIHLSCHITSATSGRTGHMLLKNRPNIFDYVLVDINIPDFSGIEILNEISKIKEDKSETQFYLISAQDIPNQANENINFIAGYIKKPITFRQLESIFYDLKAVK